MSSISNLDSKRTAARRRNSAAARRYCARRAQQGLTLVELMVGLLLALFCIATAIAVLASSRGISGSVNELSALQQQASFAMRVMSMQFRQAGALSLVRAPGVQLYGFPDSFTGVDASGVEVGGTDGTPSNPGDTVIVATQPATLLPTHNRNCLGQQINTSDPILSTFTLDAGSLRCKTQSRSATGTLGAAVTQPVISNVADFQVAYRVTLGTGGTATTQLKSATAMTAAEWPSVRAVEICLDMQATESSPDAGATYVDCNGNDKALGKHIHLVYRNVFEIRVKGTV
jgi:type IV pilus assembly protein PilW